MYDPTSRSGQRFPSQLPPCMPLLHSPFVNSKLRHLEEAILSSLSTSTTFHHLLQTHARAFTLGLHQNNFIAAKLISLCATFSSLRHASLVFHHITNPTICLYNTFIRALSQNNLPMQTLQTYAWMKRAQVSADHLTFPFLLRACAALPPSPPLGEVVHGEAMRTGFDCDVYVRSSLIDMYSKHGCLECAYFLFEEMTTRDVVTWNSMIAGFFRRENVDKGRELFERMTERNVVSWNTVIGGYAQNGRAIEALRIFRKMQYECVPANEVTLLSVLSACAQAGALETGRWVHRYVERSGIRMGILLNNTLIDMYAKGGSLVDAREAFNGMPNRSVVSWNSMISGLAMHGRGSEAISLFPKMLEEGIRPNDITFIGLLHACTHSGLVEQGRMYFHLMEDRYEIAPKVEHYGCMVDLLGRSSYVVEAYNLIKTMPFSPDAGIWGALLGACRTHGHLRIAEISVVSLLELEPWNAGNYVLLSNIYAAAGRWQDVQHVREKMRGKKLQKTPGSSSIEVNSSVYEFVSGDKSHPLSNEIYEKLDELVKNLKLSGYVPETGSVLHDICEEEKEQRLNVHSEKVALAFGIISTSAGTTLRIVKNLRVCRDCHSWTKMVSKVVEREIVMRDRIRFHHFKDGSCSCCDYW